MSEPTLTWKGRILALFLGLGFLVAVSEIALRIVYPSWNEFYAGRFMTVERVPGHDDVAVGRTKFDGFFAQNNGDFRARIRINEHGLRNERPVADADNNIWVLGDSMAFGWGVEADEMYSSVIGEVLTYPTYNVASPGTNVCGYQALLARMPKDQAPAAVVVGLILENDLLVYDCEASAKNDVSRTIRDDGPFTLLRLKGFLTENSALYNFFAVSLKRVSLVREALIWLGVVSEGHAYRNNMDGMDMDAVVSSTAFELGRLKKMLPPSTPFVVLIAPARFEIANDDPFFKEVRERVRTALDAAGIDYVDPVGRFMDAGFAPTHFAHDGHWSPAGHRIAGEAVAAWLRSRLPQ